MLNLLRNSHQRKKNGQALYDGLVRRAREPVFFAEFGVPDSIDGRFDILAFHAWMVLAELRGAPVAQDLTDTIFAGFDDAMREQGAGDMGIGHKLKAMANAFYGRMTAYDAAQDQAALAQALAKNLWRGAAVDDRARALAAYAVGARAALRRSLPDGLDFGPLPNINLPTI
jgi:cytochrome b pre-mRNA-processing protein 3